jgi:hypothetical protein
VLDGRDRRYFGAIKVLFNAANGDHALTMILPSKNKKRRHVDQTCSKLMNVSGRALRAYFISENTREGTQFEISRCISPEDALYQLSAITMSAKRLVDVSRTDRCESNGGRQDLLANNRKVPERNKGYKNW